MQALVPPVSPPQSAEMSVWDGVGLSFVVGLLASIVAAFLVWLIWWLRIRIAANRYCGRWEALDFEERKLVPMKGSPSTTIRRGGSLFHPEDLVLEAEYDGTGAEGRVTLAGDVRINPLVFNQAVVTLNRVGELQEYAVQSYFLMKNGDILVVPAVSETMPPEYKKHVLRRVKASPLLPT